MVRLALRVSAVPLCDRFRTSPPRPLAMAWARSLVAQGSFVRMSIFAVRIRLRSPLTTTVGMPLSGALTAFALTLEKESAAPGAGAPTSPPRPWAVGELPALEQAVARRSGAAIRRASLRIVFHQLSAVLCA